VRLAACHVSLLYTFAKNWLDLSVISVVILGIVMLFRTIKCIRLRKYAYFNFLLYNVNEFCVFQLELLHSPNIFPADNYRYINIES